MGYEKNAYTFKTLKVWQKSMDLVLEVYKVTQGFPNHEQYGLTSQMRRCAASIPSNIAEGHGRDSDKELIRFLNIAKGSLYELDTQIEISHKLGYLSDINILSKTIDEISRMLTGFKKFKTKDLKSQVSPLKSHP